MFLNSIFKSLAIKIGLKHILELESGTQQVKIEKSDDVNKLFQKLSRREKVRMSNFVRDKP